MKTNGAWAFSFGQVHENFVFTDALKMFCSLCSYEDAKRFQRSLFVLIVFCPIPQRMEFIGSGWAYISLTCLTTNHGKNTTKLLQSAWRI